MTNSSGQTGPLHNLAKPFVAFVEKYYPDPFVFVIVLTFIAFAAAIGMTGTSVRGAVEAWGGGLSSLLAFTAQIAITLTAAHALAHTDTVQRALHWVTRQPGSAWQAYGIVTLGAGLANLIAWSLGLVVGATLARAMAIEGARRGMRLDYPLLVACAYSGLVVWHMGYSGSAPLFVATPGHSLESVIGLVPVTETIFAPWNMALALVTLGVITLTGILMRPPPDQVRTIDEVGLDLRDDAELADESKTKSEEADRTFGDRITEARLGSLALGALLAAYLVLWFVAEGLSLNLDIVNWTFLAAGLLLARSPGHYIALKTLPLSWDPAKAK